jgi:PleD family two-component response regulator
VQGLRVPHRESSVAPVVTVTVGVASARCARPVRELMNAAAEQAMGAKVSQERNRVHRVVL